MDKVHFKKMIKEEKLGEKDCTGDFYNKMKWNFFSVQLICRWLQREKLSHTIHMTSTTPSYY